MLRLVGFIECMATLLDPIFKVKGFSAASFAEMAKSKVIEDAKKIAAVNNDPSTAPSSSNEEPEEVTVRCKKHKKESSSLTKMIQIPQLLQQKQKGS